MSKKSHFGAGSGIRTPTKWRCHQHNPFFLGKFAFDTMISKELAIPESVADFIEGRVPKKVGARHYTNLLRQADGYYARYSSYLSKLRKVAVRF